MIIKRYPRLARGMLGVTVKLSIGLVLGGLAAFVRHLLFYVGVPEQVAPFACGYPAMLVAAVLAGTVSGFAAMVVAGLATWYWAFGASTTHGTPMFVAYAVVGIMVLAITEAYRKSEARRAQERCELLEAAHTHQEMLAQETAHRLKNVLTMVQSVATQTFGKYGYESLEIFNARLQALANAQGVLSGDHNTQADLQTLVGAALQPFRGNIRFEGQSCTIADKQALWLALALHELGTNSVKYGALSTRQGEVTINVKPSGGAFHLCWSEANGPTVTAPERQGFGSKLLKQARAQVEYHPQGLKCEIPNIRCVAAA